MAKDNEQALIEQLFASLSDEEKRQFMSMMSDPDMIFQQLDRAYDYKHPNYKKQTQALDGLMKKLWEMSVEDYEHYTLDDFLAACEQMPLGNLGYECTNFLMHLLDGWNKKRPKLPECDLAVRYVIAAIEHFKLQACLDTLMEVWRQNATFYGRFFDALANVIAPMLTHFKFRTVKPLFEFVCDQRLISTVRQYMATAIGHIVRQQPELRDEVVTLLDEKLRKASSTNLFMRPIDHVTLDSICHIMALIGATKLLPELRQLISATEFFSPSLGDAKNIIKTINKQNTPEFQMLLEHDIDSCEELTQICWREIFDSEFNDDDEEDDVWEEDDWEDDDMEDDIEDAEYEEEDSDDQDGVPLFASSQITYDNKVKQPVEYELTITLRGIEPRVWRKLLVPSHIKLDSLAYVLLRAMGWENEHLYQFVKGTTHYGLPQGPNPFGPVKEFDSRVFFAATLLPRKGSTAQLDYDFGDDWEHDIVVTGIRRYAQGETPRIALIDGEGACPPEDIGGIPGYLDLVDAMKNPRSRRAREMTECLGYRYDPAKFDLQSAARSLSQLNK